MSEFKGLGTNIGFSCGAFRNAFGATSTTVVIRQETQLSTLQQIMLPNLQLQIHLALSVLPTRLLSARHRLTSGSSIFGATSRGFGGFGGQSNATANNTNNLFSAAKSGGLFRPTDSNSTVIFGNSGAFGGSGKNSVSFGSGFGTGSFGQGSGSAFGASSSALDFLVLNQVYLIVPLRPRSVALAVTHMGILLVRTIWPSTPNRLDGTLYSTSIRMALGHVEMAYWIKPSKRSK